MTINPAASYSASTGTIAASSGLQGLKKVQSSPTQLQLGSVSASISTPSVNLSPSSSASATITTVANSYNGNVVLSLGDLPFGVSYTLSRATVPGSGSSNLTISAGASARPGTYVVTVRAAAGGVSSVSSLTLVIA